MTDDLRKSIDTLRGVTSRMEAATAEAEHVVQMVERFLNDECELGVAVWSGVEHRAPAAAVGGGAGAAEAAAAAPKSLGYAKVGGRFRIAIRESASPGAGGERVYAWADAPRGEKLQVFGQLPALLNHMASLVHDYLESAGQTSVAVAGTLEVLGRGTSKTVSVAPKAPAAAAAITAPAAAFGSAARPVVKPAAPVGAPAPEPVKAKAPLVTRVPAKPRSGKAAAAVAAVAPANAEAAPKPVAPEAPPMRREYPAHHTGRPLRLF